MIYYTTDGSAPSLRSAFVAGGQTIHVTATYRQSILIRCFAVVNGMRRSAEIAAVYEIQAGTYEYERSSYSGAVGTAYLVPYYRGRSFLDTVDDAKTVTEGNKHSSKLASVDLNTTKYRTVRLRGVDSDFAEFYTFDTRDGLLYQRGHGPYSGQVKVHDLELRGFFGGFPHERQRRNANISTRTTFEYKGRRILPTHDALQREIARMRDLSYDDCLTRRSDVVESLRNSTSVFTETRGFLAPFYNGDSFVGTVVRLFLGTLEERVETTWTRRNLTDCCVLNTTEFCVMANTTTTGNESSAAQEETIESGVLSLTTTEVFHNQTSSSQDLTDALDLTFRDKRLRGFVGGFAAGDHAYFVPYHDGEGPGHVVARVDATTLTNESVEVLDLWQVDTRFAGYFGGFSYTDVTGASFGFLVPHKCIYGPVGGLNSRLPVDNWVVSGNETGAGDHTTEVYHGLLLRLRLANFTNASACVDVLDLTAFDSDLRGFAGGAVVGKFGILAPYRNDAGHFGKVVRVDLETFQFAGALDATRYTPPLTTYAAIDGSVLKGFVGVVAWGKYAVLVPHRDGRRSASRNFRSHTSTVLRIDVNDFTLSGIRTLDVAKTFRQQAPSIPDDELRGFLFGFAAGDYVYLAPHFALDFCGKLVRVDMRDFDTLAALQEADVDPQAIDIEDIDTFTGVQLVDLQRTDTDLVGFAGGFAVRSAESTIERTLDDPVARTAWFKALLTFLSMTTGVSLMCRLLGKITNWSPEMPLSRPAGTPGKPPATRTPCPFTATAPSSRIIPSPPTPRTSVPVASPC